MNSDLRHRLSTAAAVPVRPVSGAALAAEVARRRTLARRRGAIGLVVVAAVAVLTSSLTWAGSSGGTSELITRPEPNPQVTVLPNTSLINGQVVRVGMSGFRAHTRLAVRICSSAIEPGTEAEPSCDETTVQAVETSGTGDADLAYRITTVLSTDALRQIDCADGRAGCWLGVSRLGGYGEGTVLTRLHFKPLVRPARLNPALQLAWSGPPRDGVAVTVTGRGFYPDQPVTINPCIPNSDCGGYDPLATAQTGPDGTFTVHLTLHAVIRYYGGGTTLCVQKCSLFATQQPEPTNLGAATPPFDLTVLPPVDEQCQPQQLGLSYLGPIADQPDSESAVIGARNTGSQPCWVYGVPAAGADDGKADSRTYLQTTRVEQSGPAWPPKVVSLQPGDAVRFTLTKPRCTGSSVPLTEVTFGLVGGNYFTAVPLPSSGATQLSYCGVPTVQSYGGPAPEANVMSVSPFMASR